MGPATFSAFALLTACGALELPRAGLRSAAAARAPRALVRMATLAQPALELPNLDGALPDCPRTVWDSDGMDVAAEQDKLRAAALPACPLEIVATSEQNAQGAAYFTEHGPRLRELLREHGTLWFKGFDLTRDEAGFRAFYEATGLSPCLDPIHTSGLRAFASAKDAVYQEVNKQSLAGHYIGLHNEATSKKAARYGAFVCFKPATVRGGEFLIADGAAIFRDLRTDVLARLYERRVRISVSNLDMDLLQGLGPLKQGAMDAVKGLVQKVVAPKFDMDLGAAPGGERAAWRGCPARPLTSACLAPLPPFALQRCSTARTASRCGCRRWRRSSRPSTATPRPACPSGSATCTTMRATCATGGRAPCRRWA